MKHLLIVDSEPVVRDVLTEKLTAPNVVVDVAATVETALAHLARRPYDIVVVALELPAPGTRGIIDDFRMRSPHGPVIVLSRLGYINENARKIAFELGATAFLEKPIVMSSLYEALETALDFKIEGNERRRYPRIPLSLDLLLEGGTRESRLSFRTHTVDISLGGCCIEREVPEPPPPYLTGSVAPGHPFHKYATRNPEGKSFHVTLSLSRAHLHGPAMLWVPETLAIEAKVAHIIFDREAKKEFFGLKFVNFPEEERQKLKAYLRTLAEEMKA